MIDKRRPILVKKDFCIHQVFERQAAKTPGAIALTLPKTPSTTSTTAQQNEQLTYIELEQRANQLAQYLRKKGVGPEILVGICMERSLEMIVAILGVLKAGGAYVPLDLAYPKERLAFILEDTQMPLLLTQIDLVEKLPTLSTVKMLFLDSLSEAITQEKATPPVTETTPENLAYAIYTSGSTGKPKGVLISHQNVTRLFDSTDQWFQFNHHDVWTLFHSYAFDFSVWEIWGALLYGGRLVIVPYWISRSPEVFYQLLLSEQVTVLNQTPTAFSQLIQVDNARDVTNDLSLRWVIFGGEALKLGTLKPWIDRHGDEHPFLANMYGITETTVHVTFRLINARDLETVSGSVIGEAIPDLQLYVLDNDMKPVPVGSSGELFVGGAGVSQGYLNRPELTELHFVPDPFSNIPNARLYRSGDMVRKLANNDLEFLGRIDHQVKIRGFRIELGEIETALSHHPVVTNCVVLAREDTSDTKRLVAYIIPNQNEVPSAGELRDFLAKSLPDYMVTSTFIWMDKFPLTANGKIDRQALPMPGAERPNLKTAYAPADTELERRLVVLWQDVLGLVTVGVNDNFFELGGNSLLAARLLTCVQDHFQVNIPLRAFLAQPDVAGLCQVIAAEPQRLAAPHREEPGHEGLISTGDQSLGLLAQSNLTRGQFLMWMGQQMNPDTPLYNVVSSFTIYGRLDIDAFQEAFQALVTHNDALRTVFFEVNGVPQQTVFASFQAAVELVDYSRRSDPESAYQEFLHERKKRRLPLDRTLFDSVLVKLARDRFVWYFCQHHILTDAVSSELILERLSYYYQLACDGRLGDIPEPPQYADYARYERDFRQTAAHQTAVAYWQDKYGTALEPTEFYGKSLEGSSLHTTRVVQELGAERSARLRAIARSGAFASPSEDLSLFTIFATLLFTSLQRINGRHTLRLGTPFHGRPTVQSLDIIGLFIEMGVVQVDMEQGETFTSLGEKVMAEILEGLPHVRPGFSSADTNRAYDVVLNFIQARFNNFAGLPVTREPVHSGYIDAGHSLRLQITDYDDSGSFNLLFDMKTELFSEEERGWLIAHFLRVADAFIDQQDQRLGGFSLLGEEQYQQLVVDFNATDAPYPAHKTVVQLFEEQAAKTPRAAAVLQDGRATTYEELNKRANRLAAYLQEQGVGPEMAVAICMERSLEVLVAIWGVLKAGGAYIPIDPAYPSERIAYMLADAGPAILLQTDDDLLADLEVPPAVETTNLKTIDLSRYSAANPAAQAGPENLVYIIYTSGSTGRPKGTLLTHQGLQNYVCWARQVYQEEEPLAFPLYSSMAFDLTVTSIFVPLVSGGKVVVYKESRETPGMEILSVFEDKAVDIVKLTPAHLALVREMNLSSSRIRKLIVGGEDFKTDLARSIYDLFGGEVAIFNEYGPTEAVVGCMLHRYDPERDTAVSVPIGRPAANARIYLLDEYDQPVPPGVVGEMVISSDGVARGYLNQPGLTAERFAEDPFRPGARIYRSGDAARWNEAGQMVFLGRRDHQVKIGGARVELGEIESRLAAHSAIHDAVVSVVQFEPRVEESEIFHCAICGLPSNYPNVTFNDEGVCNLCVDFDTFREDVFKYFKTMDDLRAIVARAKAESSGEYDCMMLYSGGKDSTYVLSQLVEMGLRILAFSLDNGYISEEAKENVRRVTDHLGVDLVFATTPHMNAIFADSLERFSNVCQGCYKAIYTLSMNLARQKGIKYIFTGLSRGQLFETRLDELFRHRIFDVRQMDTAVLEARKVYHRVDDAVNRLLDVRMFADDRVFEEIQFVDFFRYTDVELDDLYDFLSTRVPWIRPIDTGRSTNCLINEAGIYVHKTEQGYHNYALPYSWDVRLGHKTREEAMEELDDDMRMPLVQQMLDEVGYSVKEWRADLSDRRLAAYYVTDDESVSIGELRDYLAQALPPYMVPSYFVRLDALPLTANGKVKRQELPNPLEKRPEINAAYVAPQSMLEIQLADLWSNTLKVDRIGIHDNFFDLGGASIPAVQIVARISDQFDVAFPVSSFFEHPTIAGQSVILEELLLAQVESLTDEEVAALLSELDK